MASGKVRIWRLIQRCATEFTAAGHTSFSRGDLIRCVQRTNPEYGADSINPIIQGVTDNLRGGAPGAVGKNILHSVARGRFVLCSGKKASLPQPVPTPAPAQRPSTVDTFKADAGKSVTLDCFPFLFVCRIDPARNPSGSVAEFLPQSRFRNEWGLPLNRYGAGPFCKFKIPGNLEVSGVYALVAGDGVKYIGECERLSRRYNMGYGNISPRNCFRGGQETNCRINNLILGAIKSGANLSLWFHETQQHKAVELRLRDKLRPPWNRV